MGCGRLLFNCLLALPIIVLVISTFLDFFDESPKIDDFTVITKQNMNFLKLKDGRIMEYYKNSLLTKPKKTIILLHDIYFTGKFCENYEEFWNRNQYLVVCPSLPGWGYSDLNNGTLQYYDNDIHQLLEDLKLKRFSLLSIRFGSVYSMSLMNSNILMDKIEKIGLISPLRPLIHDNKIIDFFEGIEASSEESAAQQVMTARGISHIIGYFMGKSIRNGTLDMMKASTPHDFEVLMKMKEKGFILSEMKRSIERSWKILALYLRWISNPWNCELKTNTEGFITSNSLDETTSPSHQIFVAKSNPSFKFVQYKQSHYEIYSNLRRIIKTNLD
eukprot:gene8675-622_t